MSDDDRMDRAERIRRMNEGRAFGEGGGVAGSGDDESAASDAGDESAASDASDDADEGARPAEEEAADASDEPNGADDAVAGGEDAGDAPADGADDEATATALRAAQASASVGSGVDVLGGPSATATAGEDGGTPAENAGAPDDAEADVAGVAGPAAAGATAQASAEETVRVLEFVVGDQAFCLDIDAVEEIVEHESVTRVPNAPDCVSGVVDLRGQITTILDPRTFLDAEGPEEPSLVVVFDPDAFESHGAIGWLVDEVSRVASVPESAVTDAPGDDDHVEGVVDRADEDDLVVWIDPHEALELVAGADATADG